MFPHFIGIGAQKSATTWLDRNLGPHPEIWLPPRKEIHYFDRAMSWHDPVKSRNKRRDKRRKLRKGNNKPRPMKRKSAFQNWYWNFRFQYMPRTDRWYASLFMPEKGQIAGEITPEYSIADGRTVEYVHNLMPDAKIIFLMRNPIERTWSHAVMDFRRAGKKIEDAELSELAEFFSKDHVQKRSDYLRTLDHWLRFFPEENFFLGFTEDVAFHPNELLGDVYEFLGVEASFRPKRTNRRVNSKARPTIPANVARLLAETCLEDLEPLSRRFGGYANFWKHTAEILAELSPSSEDSIPYPFSESYLAEGWPLEEYGLRSGRLSHLTATPVPGGLPPEAEGHSSS